MNNPFAKLPPIPRIVVISVLMLFFIIFSILIVMRNITAVEQSQDKLVQHKVSQLSEYFSVSKHLLFTLRNAMEANIALAESGALTYPSAKRIQDFSLLHIYALEPLYLRASKKDALTNTAPSVLTLAGTLSGIGSIRDMSTGHQKEIHAALASNALLKSVLHSLPELKRVYYVSKNKFTYILPAVGIDKYHLKEDDLDREFWVKAKPQNNPSLGMIITHPYENSEGKGMMISMSLPVMHKGEFRGVIALDIGMDTLLKKLSTHTALGSSTLIDEHRKIILQETTVADKSNDLIQKNASLEYTVLDKQITLTHRIKPSQKYARVIVKSIGSITLLFVTIFMTYSIYRLRGLIKKTKHLANTDPLTSLMNRRAMEAQSQTLINLSYRFGHKMCFFIADIDHFKKINDNYGHAEGDRILMGVSKSFTSSLRETDIVSRHGGEEFLILLPNTGIDEAYRLTERLRKRLEGTTMGEQQLKVTISIGCVELRQNESYSDVIKRADEALYCAKNGGRNRTVVA